MKNFERHMVLFCCVSNEAVEEQRERGEGKTTEEESAEMKESSYKRQCLQFLDSPPSVQNMTLVFEKCCNCNPFNKFQEDTIINKIQLWHPITKRWKLLSEEWAWKITSILSNYSRYDFQNPFKLYFLIPLVYVRGTYLSILISMVSMRVPSFICESNS